MAAKRKRGVSTTGTFFVRAVKPLKGRKQAPKNFHLKSEFDGDLDMDYAIVPRNDWLNLTSYTSFAIPNRDKALEPEKFSAKDIVVVANSDLAIKQGVSLDNIHDSWIAQVLEIRAKDASHVYVLVQWLYWPAELPSGKEPYHARYELVGSNHLDIIEATTISCKWEVTKWSESDDDDDIPGLFWRQTYNILTRRLSILRKHCVCHGYYNPEQSLIRCDNANCNLWLHAECLIKYAVDKKHEELLIDDFEYAKSVIPGKKPAWAGLLHGSLTGLNDDGSKRSYFTQIRDLRYHGKDFVAKTSEKGYWSKKAKCPKCETKIS